MEVEADVGFWEFRPIDISNKSCTIVFLWEQVPGWVNVGVNNRFTLRGLVGRVIELRLFAFPPQDQ